MMPASRLTADSVCEGCGVGLVPRGHAPGEGQREHASHNRCRRCYGAVWRAEQPAEMPTQLWHVQPWSDRALCATKPPRDDLFFPEPGGTPRLAKEVCAQCPVRFECLTWALECHDRLEGVWGGTTEHERRPMRERRRLGGAA